MVVVVFVVVLVAVVVVVVVVDVVIVIVVVVVLDAQAIDSSPNAAIANLFSLKSRAVFSVSVPVA